MARAYNIYLVVWHDYDGVDPKAAFTVKHEMITWLRKQPPDDLVGCGVLRMRDGEASGPLTTMFTIAELLGE